MKMNDITDEQIVAFVDGELDAETYRAIAGAVASDPGLAERVERYRRVRTALGEAFAPLAAQPVPEDLRRLVENAGTTPPRAATPFAPIAASLRHAADRLGRPVARGAAMAASVVVGLAIGWSLPPAGGPVDMAEKDGGLVATGRLAHILEDSLSGESMTGADTRIVFSFPGRHGELCRVFAREGAASMSGVACRDENDWRLVALASGSGVAGDNSGRWQDYRPAGAEPLPSAIESAVDALRTGDPLGAGEEAAARERGWRR